MEEPGCKTEDEKTGHEAKIKKLQRTAEKAKKAVTERNIYLDRTLRRLEVFEDEVAQIAAQIGIEFDRAIEIAQINSPLQLLTDAIEHWDQKLGVLDLPSEDELVHRLTKDFRIKIERVDKDLIPPDKTYGNEDIRTGTEEKSTPKDANRVALALQTILKTDIQGIPIQLDNLKVFVGAFPQESWRQRPYWIIAIENLRIAVFVNNQAWNQTFVLSYKSADDLENLAAKTKKELKEESGKDHIIYNFNFHDPDQFAKELAECLSKIAEGKVIRKMDKAYFEDIENIRKDLDEVRKAAKLKDIENLIPHSFDKSKNTQCSNGEIVKGATYLLRAGVALGLAKNVNDAASKKALILNELKRKIGIRCEEIKTYPAMDKEYFVEETIRKDLETFRIAANLDSIEQLTTNNMYPIEALCVNGEDITGSTYLSRAGKALDFGSVTKKTKKHPSVTLKRLKKIIGLKVEEEDLNIHPDMDRPYFNNTQNVRADLNEYRKSLGLEDVKELNTTHFSSDRKVLCSNGELVSGLSYILRAGRALGFAKSGRKASSMKREVLDALKRKIGIEVEEIKKYPKMDRQYFSRENVINDLGEYARACSTSIADLNTNKMTQAGAVICRNTEPTTGRSYILRAGQALGFGNSRKEVQHRLGDIIAKLKEIALS